jgi:hypothetical protein
MVGDGAISLRAAQRSIAADCVAPQPGGLCGSRIRVSVRLTHLGYSLRVRHGLEVEAIRELVHRALPLVRGR